MTKNKLLLGGGIILGTAVLIIAYLLFSLFNINQAQLKKYELMFKTESASKIYDGEPLSKPVWSLQSGKLAEGHRVEVVMDTEITNPGSTKNKIGITIIDEEGEDVTNLYNIIYDLGTLTIHPLYLFIRTESLEKVYDGLALTSQNWELTSGTLLPGHGIVAVMNASITEPGTVTNNIGITIVDHNGKDASEFYKIIYDLGSLTVHKRNLTIRTESREKDFDGTPLTSSDWSLYRGTLSTGHSLQVVMDASIIYPGVIQNTAGVTVVDQKGEDATRFYEIEYLFGELRIHAPGIVIWTESLEKVFDGEPLESSRWEFLSGRLQEGHRIEAKMNSTITYPGEIPNEIGVTILDENDEDVTNHYWIEFVLGSLTVHKIPLVIKTGSATKVYDGTPLRNEEWELLHGDLLENHRLIASVEGEITDVGTVDNHIHVYVVDENGNDVTNYYEIIFSLGKLNVISSIYSSRELPRNPIEPPNEILLQILADNEGVIYLRDKSWGDYNLGGWETAYPFEKAAPINPLSLNGLALLSEGKAPRAVEIRHLRKGIPHLLPYYAVDGFPDGNDVHVYGEVEPSYAHQYISHDFLNNPINLTDPELSGFEREYRDFVRDVYLRIPPSTKSQMLAIAEQNGLRADSPTVITDVRDFIRRAAKYNLDFEPIPEEVDIAVYFLTVSKEGVCTHFTTAATLMYRALGIPARYVTGFVGYPRANAWTDIPADQAHAWVEVYLEGLGWIPVEATGTTDAGAKITVQPKNVSAPYFEGAEPLRATEVEVFGFKEFAEKGYTYHYVLGGELAGPGIGQSRVVEFTVYDENGNDVTDEFSITFRNGTLQYYCLEITFVTGGGTKVYDGTPLSNSEWSIIGELAEGHYIDEKSLKFTGSRVNVGISKNSAKIVIRDENGQDVTELYSVINEFGDLIVTPRPLKVISKDATKQYDGTPLICHEYELEGELAPGDEIQVVISGTQTNVGRSDNLIQSVTISNQSGDATMNYIIECIAGRLTVTP
jgi:transglutaminase-like putative cysteine protease/uncharacterized protein YnzC (UPF0291/DUF896 family)